MPRKKKDATETPTVDQGQADLDQSYQGRKKKQAELAGFERKSDPVLDVLASEYAAKAAERGQLSADLKKLNAKIDQAMTERKLEKYLFVDGEVERMIEFVGGKRKVRVVAVRDDDEGAGE